MMNCVPEYYRKNQCRAYIPFMCLNMQLFAHALRAIVAARTLAEGLRTKMYVNQKPYVSLGDNIPVADSSIGRRS